MGDVNICTAATLGVAVRHVVCGFQLFIYFSSVMLPSEVPRFATDSPVRVFPGVWKLLSFLRLPSQDGSPSLPLLSLFVFYIFSYLLLKTMGCFFG